MKTPNYLHPPPTPSLTYSVGCWELQTLTSQYKSLYLQFFCVGALTRGDGTTIFSSPTFLALLQASSQVVEQIEVLLKEDSWEVKTFSFLPQMELHWHLCMGTGMEAETILCILALAMAFLLLSRDTSRPYAEKPQMHWETLSENSLENAQRFASFIHPSHKMFCVLKLRLPEAHFPFSINL